MKKTLLFFIVLGFANPCFAKAYYAPKKEMIQKAECIVIVDITAVETTEKKGKTWTYSQKVSATVKQRLKGDVKGEVEIYGMENFICAQCRYEVGAFILFLRKDEGFWVGSNWHLGIRPIKDDKVLWFADDQTRLEMKELPLEDVIKEVDAVVEEQKKLTPNKPDTGVFIGGMAVSATDESPSMHAEIIDYGLYTQPIVARTYTGADNYKISVATNLTLVTQTNVVHAKLGDYVGFRYRLNVTTMPPPRILVCVTLPPKPVLDPARSEPMDPVWRLVDCPLVSHVGFIFEEDWECVPGEWLFQIRTETALLAEKTIMILFDKEADSNTTPQRTRQ